MGKGGGGVPMREGGRARGVARGVGGGVLAKGGGVAGAGRGGVVVVVFGAAVILGCWTWDIFT